jgi:hypothetical protein
LQVFSICRRIAACAASLSRASIALERHDVLGLHGAQMLIASKYPLPEAVATAMWMRAACGCGCANLRKGCSNKLFRDPASLAKRHRVGTAQRRLPACSPV